MSDTNLREEDDLSELDEYYDYREIFEGNTDFNPFSFRSSSTDAFDDSIKRLGLKHFGPWELRPMGGAHYNSNSSCFKLNDIPPEEKWNNIVNTIKVVDDLREDLNIPIRINSAYRSPDYNSCIKGRPRSLHLRFNALDIAFVGISSIEGCKELLSRRKAGVFSGGLGIYKTFVHIDTRGRDAEWKGNGTPQSYYDAVFSG